MLALEGVWPGFQEFLSLWALKLFGGEQKNVRPAARVLCVRVGRLK